MLKFIFLLTFLPLFVTSIYPNYTQLSQCVQACNNNVACYATPPTHQGLYAGGECPDAELALNLTNSYRARHQASRLKWSTKLASQSQYWAKVLIDRFSCESLAHSPFSVQYGENTALLGIGGVGAKSQDRIKRFGCRTGMFMWYGEVAGYTFDTTDPVKANDYNRVGHFTQTVWKKTKHMGCGYATGNFTDFKGVCMITICQYWPSGNWGGSPGLRRNVKPPLW